MKWYNHNWEKRKDKVNAARSVINECPQLRRGTNNAVTNTRVTRSQQSWIIERASMVELQNRQVLNNAKNNKHGKPRRQYTMEPLQNFMNFWCDWLAIRVRNHSPTDRLPYPCKETQLPTKTWPQNHKTRATANDECAPTSTKTRPRFRQTTVYPLSLCRHRPTNDCEITKLLLSLPNNVHQLQLDLNVTKQ